MKKARKRGVDELRSEYKRSDFDVLVRGKYIERLREKSNVVVLDPRVTELFPNAESVNSALLSLAEIAKRSARLPRRRARRPRALAYPSTHPTVGKGEAAGDILPLASKKK
jgi:hypothetical protein